MDDYSNYRNPYDFANPVSKKALFAGRKGIKSEIDYYLDQASKVTKPINLALLGDRSSGKTSLLNIIDIIAAEKSMLPIRINLDEGDAINQFTFFNKLFNTILDKACEAGAFGGLTKKTYQTYLALKNTLSIPEDQTYLSFQFPIQYVQVIKSGNQDLINVQDNSIEHDINLIQKEIGKTIVVTIDECNVIKSNKIILQKLRNIFMNQPGYMIVIAGTRDFFPVLDDVFSPIIRQFKRIEIEEFKNIDETKDCIRKPLSDAAINEEKLFKNGRIGSLLTDIHTLTHGKPYEIQLLCYSMFKRIQLKQTKHMILDVPVLEEVRAELRKGQQSDESEIIDCIENLNKEDLKALAVFFDAGEKSSIATLKCYEYIIYGDKRLKLSKFNDYFDKFIDLKILSQNEDGFKFNGDDFDAIYAKYYARKKGVLLLYLNWPFDFGIAQKLSITIRNRASGLLTYSVNKRDAENEDHAPELISKINEINTCINGADKDIFSEYEDEMESIFGILVENDRLNSSIRLYSIKLPLNQDIILLEYYSDISRAAEITEKLEKFLTPIIERADEFNVRITLEIHDVELPELNSMIKLLNQSENEKVRTIIAEDHCQKFADAYIYDQDRIKSKYYSTVIEAIEANIDELYLNNLAYFHLVEDDYTTSEKYLLRAFDKIKDIDEAQKAKLEVDEQLWYYNLACTYVGMNKISRARDALYEAKKISTSDGSSNIACLLKMLEKNGRIELVEEFNIDDISSHINNSINVVEHVMASPQAVPA